MKIKNRTDWKTEHLRAFIFRALDAEEIPQSQRRHLVVEFMYHRAGTRCLGRATMGGHWMRLNLGRDTQDHRVLAHIAVHEAGHLRGRNHLQMQGKPAYTWVEGWKELVAWADALPLEKKVVKPGPTRGEDLSRRLIHSEAMIAKWKTKIKFAQTSLRKWSRRFKDQQRKVAAIMAVEGNAGG